MGIGHAYRGINGRIPEIKTYLAEVAGIVHLVAQPRTGIGIGLPLPFQPYSCTCGLLHIENLEYGIGGSIQELQSCYSVAAGYGIDRRAVIEQDIGIEVDSARIKAGGHVGRLIDSSALRGKIAQDTGGTVFGPGSDLVGRVQRNALIGFQPHGQTVGHPSRALCAQNGNI